MNQNYSAKKDFYLSFGFSPPKVQGLLPVWGDDGGWCVVVVGLGDG